jgi:predicted O-methyltransferase YrrM
VCGLVNRLELYNDHLHTVRSSMFLKWNSALRRRQWLSVAFITVFVSTTAIFEIFTAHKSVRRPFLTPVKYLDPLDDADARILAPHYAALVAEFADELRTEFAAAEAFTALTKGSDVVCKGQIGRVEASMLYIAIRVERPRHVVEVGALCGSSTRWILAALNRNGGNGALTTFDLNDVAPRFMSLSGSANTDRWKFIHSDVLTYIREFEESVVTEADLIFIDALHRNAFAQVYTRELLGHMRRRVLVFVHDIYSPFMIPIYKTCQMTMTEETLDEERQCILMRATEFTRRQGTDTFYGPTQAGGEGAELTSWLARTGRSRGLVTFSPYAAPEFSRHVFKAFRHAGLDFSQINNPSIFFELQPA